MIFEAKFFEKEKRDGFVIEPMMKHAWAAELKVLSMVDEICQKYGIMYFADWGTLLGAVRHQGYIPWDDDIDICMKREDFQRFAQAMEMGHEELELHSIFHDADWGTHAAHIATKHLMITERRRLKEWYGFPFQVGLDIFVIDAVPKDKMLAEEQREILGMISDVRKHKSKKILSDIESACNIKFSQTYPTDQELLILSEEVMGAYNQCTFDFYTQKDCFVNRDDYFISAEAYADVIRMPFENITIPVPIGYDEILRCKYGAEYMTPMKIDAGHEYPFYQIFTKKIYQNQSFETTGEADTFIRNISSGFYDRFIHRDAIPKVLHENEWFLGDNNPDMEEVQRVRAAQMEILYELERICDQEHVRLFAIGHTLESTLKYQGYAPGEESITMGVMREDYQIFLRLLQEQLGVWFDYGSIYSDESYDRLSILIMTDDYMCEESEAFRRFHGCPYTVGIEVLPIDYVSDEEQKETDRNMLVRSLYMTANSIPAKGPYDEKYICMAEQWNDSMNLNLNLQGNLKREFLKAVDTYMGMFGENDGNRVKIFGNQLEGMNQVYDANFFEETIDMPFENMRMPVPRGYQNM